MTYTLMLCMISAANTYGLPVELLYSIAKVESRLNPKAISKDGHDYGLMQIRKKYSTLTKEQLLDGCTNVKEAARLLAYKKDRCKHKLDNTFVVCYNRGIAGGARVTNPYKDIYYKKIIGAKQ